MSHLRAPAARADRREGGRHGRQVARPAPSLPETHIRPQLLRLAVLPPIAVALSGCAAVLFTVRTTGARPGLVLWGVLGGALSVTLAGILIAAVAADRAAAMVSDRVGALRRSSARREAELRALVEGLRRGEVPPGRAPRSGPPEGADDFELLAADLARAHDGAVTAVVQAAQLSSQAGSEQKLEVFVNLARRLQSLVHREISILDELENEIEDPDLLKGLFHVDHLATRIRRHAENLAVLGGAVSRRQWSNPVSMTEVLRSAIAEVEQYSRVKLVPPIDGTLRGHAVADFIHLLAELVENATVFSAPHTQVLLRANLVTSGLAVEVEDRGLGMPVAEQQRMNALLTDPDQVNVASLLADGRIGLFVVSQLAKRHGIHVRLQSNIYGGVQAVLVVPQALLGSAPGMVGAQPPEGAVSGVGVPRSPGPQRPGPPARHRGAPAGPRPGGDPSRRKSQGTAGANLNGHATPTATGARGAGSADGERRAAAGAEGDGRAPRVGERASSDTGGGASGVAGGGEFAAGVGGPEPGVGRRGREGAGSAPNGAGGGGGASGGNGTSLEAGAPAGGTGPDQGRFIPEGGGSGPDGFGSSSSGSASNSDGVGPGGTLSSAGGSGTGPDGAGSLAGGNAAVSDGRWQSAGGNGFGAAGIASSADGGAAGPQEIGPSTVGNAVGPGGGAFSAGGSGTGRDGAGPLAGGNGVVPDERWQLAGGNGVGLTGIASSAGGSAAGPQGIGLSAGGDAAGLRGSGPAAGGNAVGPNEAGPSADGDGTEPGGLGVLAVGQSAGSYGTGPSTDGNGAGSHGNGRTVEGNAAAPHGNGRAAGNGKAGRPAPLPVRGAQAGRPNPAEAVPGIRAADRRLVAEHVVAPPTPRAGTVRGTMGKPQLPRRRAQEHIVPQLRGGPAPRQDAEYLAGHDPGLMAAFQRGISLAEAQQHLESDSSEPEPSVPAAPPHMASDHMGPAHTAAGHMEPISNMPPASQESRRVPSPDPSAAFDFDLGPGRGRTDTTPTTGSAAIDVGPMERPHISDPRGLGPDRTTPRHDGSAPAG